MQIKRLYKLLQTLNLKVKFHNDEVDYNSSSRTIFIQAPSPKRIFLEGKLIFVEEQQYFISSVLHELGHYLAAPSSRRKKRNYGIPDSYPERVSNKWQAEEEKAKLLEDDLSVFVCGPLSDTKRKSLFLVGYERKRLMQSHSKWYETKGKHITREVIALAESL